MKSTLTYLRIFQLLPALLLLTNLSYAQNIPTYEQTVIPSTPDASVLSRYIDYPVSMSTGVPDISIPLYTLKSKKLSVPISISYHGGGIKVMDRSVTMGAGWALNAGGVISRVVRDIPDESQNGYFNMIYPDENQVTGYNKDFCLANGLIDIYTAGAAKLDGEPDIFYYNFLDQGGKFLFRNRVVPGIDPQPVPIPYTPIKITGSPGAAGFSIVDLNGNTYSFQDVGDRTITTASYPTDPNGGAIISAWYLTKIVSADKTDSISFSYEQGVGSYINYDSHTAITMQGQLALGSGTQLNTGIVEYTTDASRLTEITGVNGKVDFSYNSTTGTLNSINIYNNTSNVYTELKSFQFTQSQFANCTRPRLDAVQETSFVNNVAGQQIPPYTFTYYTPDAPPDYSYGQDMWGFYNGQNNTDMLFVTQQSYLVPGSGNYTKYVPAPQKRTVDPESSKKGILSQITYPTGGFSNFVFEPNQITTNVPVTTTTTPAPVTHYLSNFDMQPNDPVTGVSMTFTAQVQAATFDLTASYSCNRATGGDCVSNTTIAILYDITANTQVSELSLGNFTDTQTHETSTSFLLTIGDQYQLYFPSPGLISSYDQTPNFRLNATVTEILQSQTQTNQVYETVYAGGLRIHQITHNDGNGNTLIKTYNYTQPYFNSSLFNGSFDYAITALSRSQRAYNNSYPPYSSSIEQVLAYATGTTTTYNEGLSIPIGGTSNSSVSYQQVEEVITGSDSSTLGKTVFTFNTAQDYYSTMFPLFRMENDYIRSQLLDKQIYKNDNNGNLVLINDVANTYNNVNQFNGDVPGVDSIKFYAAYSDFNFHYTIGSAGITAFSLRDASPGYASMGCNIFTTFLQSFLHISPFYFHVVRPFLMSTVNTTYDINGQNPVSSETDYAYDNYAHMQPTRVSMTNSDQKVNLTTNKYPLDYSYQTTCNLQAAITTFNQQLTALKTLREQNQETDITNNNLTGYDQDESTYESSVATLVSQYNTSLTQFQQCYTAVEAGLATTDHAIALMQDKNIITPKISVINTVNGAQNLAEVTNYGVYDAEQNIIKPQQINIQVGGNSAEARAQFYAYDNSGNLLEQSKTAGPHISYLWGYNKTYPIAQVSNCKNNDIFYDSFEEGDGNTADPKTGHYSYTGIYTNTLNGLDNGQYILSYWQKAGTTWSLITAPETVSNGTFTIALGNSSAALEIDDVRFYPSGAQMTTYTYDPLIGMTSSTAPNGKIIYYEYDGFQRLLNIKDQYGNIVKSYTYHYQGQ